MTKFGDFQAGVKRYQSIPKSDFDALFNFPSPPLMPRVCKTCGLPFGSLAWSWSEVAHELKLGHASNEYILMGYCPEHIPYGEDKEEDDLPEEDEED